MNSKALVFDMDGTLADFYNVPNWLEQLINEDSTPYKVAEPMYNMVMLNELLNKLKKLGWKIVVTSWLAKNSSEEYKAKVRKAKIEWLSKYNFPYDEIHLVKYGTTKADCTRKKYNYQVLIDDNESIRKGWSLGDTIDANENIIEELKKLM